MSLELLRKVGAYARLSPQTASLSLLGMMLDNLSVEDQDTVLRDHDPCMNTINFATSLSGLCLLQANLCLN